MRAGPSTARRARTLPATSIIPAAERRSVYINHHRIKIRAIKNIEPGDEITYDYGKDHFNAYIKPHGCKCDKCLAKRAKERAEARAASARKKKRLARKLASSAAERSQSPQ